MWPMTALILKFTRWMRKAVWKRWPALRTLTQNFANAPGSLAGNTAVDEEARVEALARLISGDHVTDISRANAREMLGLGAQ